MHATRKFLSQNDFKIKFTDKILKCNLYIITTQIKAKITEFHSDNTK